MTQEEKELLTKVLCEQLPYRVQVEMAGLHNHTGILTGIEGGVVSTDRGINYPLSFVKPYLRPILSMTEEEKKKVCSLNGISSMELNERLKWNMYEKVYTIETFDLFNALHIDYRNLIPKGLAIAVTEDNNPYKE